MTAHSAANVGLSSVFAPRLQGVLARTAFSDPSVASYWSPGTKMLRYIRLNREPHMTADDFGQLCAIILSASVVQVLPLEGV